jgi:hypothetical protein
VSEYPPVARLSFKKRYVAPILEGVKVQTIRRNFTGEAGDVVEATCAWGDPPFAKLKIVEVERIVPGLLTDEDARLDGHENAADLRKAIHDIYGDVRAVARVRFEVLGNGR